MTIEPAVGTAERRGQGGGVHRTGDDEHVRARPPSVPARQASTLQPAASNQAAAAWSSPTPSGASTVTTVRPSSCGWASTTTGPRGTNGRRRQRPRRPGCPGVHDPGGSSRRRTSRRRRLDDGEPLHGQPAAGQHGDGRVHDRQTRPGRGWRWWPASRPGRSRVTTVTRHSRGWSVWLTTARTSRARAVGDTAPARRRPARPGRRAARACSFPTAPRRPAPSGRLVGSSSSRSAVTEATANRILPGRRSSSGAAACAPSPEHAKWMFPV